MSRLTRIAVASLAALAALPAQAQETEAEARCTAAMDLAVEGVRLTEASYSPAGDDSPADHCILRGVMAERTGADGQPYALRFELRLPDDWSGRFLHQFNGGADGEVVPALGGGAGIGDVPALGRGFAVVSSDAGHDGAARPDRGLAGGTAFGHDFEARRMYGYGAVETLQPAAMALTEAYYGEAPHHVYGYGRSNGGRHGLVQAERMPGAFDGILAGFPGFNLPRTGLQSALDIQLFLSLGGTLADAFSREDLTVVAQSVLDACDALDGLEDGVVNAMMECQQEFDPQVMVCTDGQNSDCLSAEQVDVLVARHAGPVSAGGEPLYNSWYWDPGIASGNWRFWNLESPIPPWDHNPLIATMAAGATAQIFSTPPVEVGGSPQELLDFMAGFDIEAGSQAIFARTGDFPESAMSLIAVPNVDDPTLEAFEAEEGRLIIFHGAADPVFSVKDTIDYVERVQANNPEADDFLRLYLVPGMPHGPGGNSASQFDLLDALVAWVEGGEAPGTVEAAFPEGDAESAANAGHTRPLCVYPQVAQYAGDNPAVAASFDCR
ncbi:tannase/feruloyl esterase family alpha/beta hydrolase [Pararhodobacter marinus]|uniref:tannase/feruloyl esterase family alpha/beta hydrolase n=1 Tax=Pararhodobacter marinus TaxID=2184063 RepID=UPI0035170356